MGERLLEQIILFYNFKVLIMYRKSDVQTMVVFKTTN